MKLTDKRVSKFYAKIKSLPDSIYDLTQEEGIIYDNKDISVQLWRAGGYADLLIKETHLIKGKKRYAIFYNEKNDKQFGIVFTV